MDGHKRWKKTSLENYEKERERLPEGFAPTKQYTEQQGQRKLVLRTRKQN